MASPLYIMHQVIALILFEQRLDTDNLLLFLFFG
jgi:hypothetical protein